MKMRLHHSQHPSKHCQQCHVSHKGSLEAAVPETACGPRPHSPQSSCSRWSLKGPQHSPRTRGLRHPNWLVPQRCTCAHRHRLKMEQCNATRAAVSKVVLRAEAMDHRRANTLYLTCKQSRLEYGVEYWDTHLTGSARKEFTSAGAFSNRPSKSLRAVVRQ